MQEPQSSITEVFQKLCFQFSLDELAGNPNLLKKVQDLEESINAFEKEEGTKNGG